MEKKQTSFVVKIDDAQRLKLESLLQEKGWDFAEAPYAHWKVSGPKINLVAYCSGKLTIQGGNAAEFVEFTLEPEILGALLNAGGGNTAPADVDRSPHGGIDESGKGDFFGPLAVACVFSGGEVAEQLAAAGVCDSKMISSDRKIYDLEKQIKAICGDRCNVLLLRNNTYNRLYRQIGNLNRLLAWGHARVMENVLNLHPECPRMISDQFAREEVMRRALLEKGRQITFEQFTKAERDVAVAAASILARAAFIRQMDAMSEELGVKLIRGAGPQVRQAAVQLVEKHGPDVLEQCAKVHFKTYNEVLGLPVEEKPPWKNSLF